MQDKEEKEMIADKMKGMVANSSAIRAMFEEGTRMAELYGAENVYDFSLGNPNVPAPASVKRAIIELLDEEDPVVLHGYTNSNSGYADVRQTVADSLNRRFGTSFEGKNIIMTVGAAGGLNVILKTLLNPGDEVITFAPYFGEYRSYVNNYDGVLVEVSPDTGTFQPRLTEFEAKITPRTRAVIVNTPNNPTGVVYSEDTIKRLAAIMDAKQREYGTDIYLISDEPYRELVYDGTEVPFIPNLYPNTIVCYSYSKSLSLPGERIGYICVPDGAADSGELYAAVAGAARAGGHVCAPSLWQKVIARCAGLRPDLAAYEKNRRALQESLTAMGYRMASPDGAFYLFIQAPNGDDLAFSEMAKEKNLLLVPGTGFGCPGWFRICYCVSYDMIQRSLPVFQALMEACRS